VADFVRTLALVSVFVSFAAGAVGIGRVTAQQTVPGTAACTALDAGMFTAVATLTATYDSGSAAPIPLPGRRRQRRHRRTGSGSQYRIVS
jgi:hypothetical protein